MLFPVRPREMDHARRHRTSRCRHHRRRHPSVRRRTGRRGARPRRARRRGQPRARMGRRLRRRADGRGESPARDRRPRSAASRAGRTIHPRLNRERTDRDGPRHDSDETRLTDGDGPRGSCNPVGSSPALLVRRAVCGQCSRFACMRSPGAVHVVASRSNSSQVALRTSPEGGAVTTRNSSACFDDSVTRALSCDRRPVRRTRRCRDQAPELHRLRRDGGRLVPRARQPSERAPDKAGTWQSVDSRAAPD